MTLSIFEWRQNNAYLRISFQELGQYLHRSNQQPLSFSLFSFPSFNSVFNTASEGVDDLFNSNIAPSNVSNLTSNLLSNSVSASDAFAVNSTIGWGTREFTFAEQAFAVGASPVEEFHLLSETASAAVINAFVDFTELLSTITFSTGDLASFSLFGTNLFNTAPTAKNYVVTHGYQSSADAEWVSNIGDAIKGFDTQANVILVDWEDAANPDGLFGFDYGQAAENTFEVGQQLGELLEALPVNPNDVQLIGHSLGAHVSGIAGDYYEDLTGFDLDVIVGLDPAGPGFEGPDIFNGFSTPTLGERLDATDAEQVVAYHTSSTLGYDDLLGDLDLYVNPDDLFQPGQLTFVGNHGYAHTLYTQLLNGQTFVQPDGSVFDYRDQFTLAGSFNIETVA